ncbi:uncharacterized protein LACBIDRAFT_325206 [Laccaria bicolor S238N-H82]|uniref:Predicted protein n=1 Tax=Laccaria bicolor (strain S238N-H82 / ATCC MYA-4686) TaxID=486041 RepID=B0D468_LACBS|nr:uncharacterized protein LACBIDRAFT_325206 [Laccaria bicolor S238N-H82]EDR10280.1 predicted protein [Laccaria bicolor S238N-H82]|eukprot:XP_001878730.1 predicted protein [Laccaria bicolor S238N-H82]
MIKRHGALFILEKLEISRTLTNPFAESDIAKDVGTTFLKSAAKESGKQAVDYEKDHGQEQLAEARQKMDQAKAEAQQMAANHAGRGDTSESADCQLAKVEKAFLV